MERTSLRDQWADELADLWSAEQELLGVLPNAGTGPEEETMRVFRAHRARTEGHVERLREIFRAGTLSERSKSSDPTHRQRAPRAKRRDRGTMSAGA
jgi:ferritin-like metal-binding protein YciE